MLAQDLFKNLLVKIGGFEDSGIWLPPNVKMCCLTCFYSKCLLLFASMFKHKHLEEDHETCGIVQQCPAALYVYADFHLKEQTNSREGETLPGIANLLWVLLSKSCTLSN